MVLSVSSISWTCVVHNGWVLLCVVDGDVLNEFNDNEEDDEVDDDDSDSDDSDHEFRVEFRKYKAHYYTDKLDFEHVTQLVLFTDSAT